MKSDKRVEFTPPPGSLPEGKGIGDDFDLVCTFRVEQSGRVCLKTMGETPLGGDDKDYQQPPGYGDMAKAIASSSGSMAGGDE